jgi:hypothetical protein
MPEAHQTLAADCQKLANPAIRKQVPARHYKCADVPQGVLINS